MIDVPLPEQVAPDRAALVRVRLHPSDDDDPFFHVIDRFSYMGAKLCTHDRTGFSLDEIARVVKCRQCGEVVDAFDALLAYAGSEKRLVRARAAIVEHAEKEAEKRERKAAREPFLRRVVKRTPIKDKTLKAEPVVGYRLKLACGHVTRWDGERPPRHRTCATCQTLKGGA